MGNGAFQGRVSLEKLTNLTMYTLLCIIGIDFLHDLDKPRFHSNYFSVTRIGHGSQISVMTIMRIKMSFGRLGPCAL